VFRASVKLHRQPAIARQAARPHCQHRTESHIPCHRRVFRFGSDVHDLPGHAAAVGRRRRSRIRRRTVVCSGNPALATVFSIACKPCHRRFGSNWSQSSQPKLAWTRQPRRSIAICNSPDFTKYFGPCFNNLPGAEHGSLGVSALTLVWEI
jgi:hypothetical protein